MADKQPTRRISIRSVLRDPLDLSKLGRALIAAAIAKNEADAQADDATTKDKPNDVDQPRSEDET